MPPTLRQIKLTMYMIKIPDTQVLIAHQANGSPEAPPIEQIGTWEDPPARPYYFKLNSEISLDFIASSIDIRLVAIELLFT